MWWVGGGGGGRGVAIYGFFSSSFLSFIASMLYIRFSCYQDVNMFVTMDCVCRCVWYVLTKQTTFIQL